MSGQRTISMDLADQLKNAIDEQQVKYRELISKTMKLEEEFNELINETMALKKKNFEQQTKIFILNGEF